MFTFGYLFSRMSWSNICFHRYFSQYLSLYEVFNVHSLRKAKPLEVSSKLLYQSTFISNAFGSGQLHSFMFLTEWRWRDSNSWPPACKAGALPTELHPHLVMAILFNCLPMGLSGLEPPTSRVSGVRSNRLSYKPSVVSDARKFLSGWRRRDSNSRPPACKAGALPTELRPRLKLAATCSPTPSPVQYHRPLRS